MRTETNAVIIDEQQSKEILVDQEQMVRDLIATGKPVIVVLQNGAAIDITDWVDKAAAVVEAWYPGEQGGTALADVLFGDYNPAGRLPISIPRDVGQLPVYYNQRIPRGHDYVEESSMPLYPFGYGLSYTTFDYTNLRIQLPDGSQAALVERQGDLAASIDVTNSGQRDGEEVVQLYVIDEIASTVRPRRQLCGFTRIKIPAGETRTVTIPIDRRCFEMVNTAGQTVVEPGTFRIQAGASSEDIRCETTIVYEL